MLFLFVSWVKVGMGFDHRQKVAIVRFLWRSSERFASNYKPHGRAQKDVNIPAATALVLWLLSNLTVRMCVVHEVCETWGRLYHEKQSSNNVLLRNPTSAIRPRPLLCTQRRTLCNHASPLCYSCADKIWNPIGSTALQWCNWKCYVPMFQIAQFMVSFTGSTKGRILKPSCHGILRCNRHPTHIHCTPARIKVHKAWIGNAVRMGLLFDDLSNHEFFLLVRTAFRHGQILHKRIFTTCGFIFLTEETTKAIKPRKATTYGTLMWRRWWWKMVIWVP